MLWMCQCVGSVCVVGVSVCGLFVVNVSVCGLCVYCG